MVARKKLNEIVGAQESLNVRCALLSCVSVCVLLKFTASSFPVNDTTLISAYPEITLFVVRKTQRIKFDHIFRFCFLQD